MKRRVLTLLLIMAIFSLACGLIDEEVATVTYEAAIPMEFFFDAAEFCPDCPDEGGTAQETIELEPIELRIPMSADDFELSGNLNIRDITQRMRSLEITSIDYVVSDNSLTFDLPAMELFVMPTTADDPGDANSIFLTTVPTAPALTDIDKNAPVQDAAREPASDLLKSLDFNGLLRAQPVIAVGQPVPPAGSADVTMTVNVKIVANAIEAASN